MSVKKYDSELKKNFVQIFVLKMAQGKLNKQEMEKLVLLSPHYTWNFKCLYNICKNM